MPTGLSGGVGHLGGMQQSLGGDAPPVQAGATEFVSFDQGDPQTEFGRPQRAGITATAAAQNDDVVGRVAAVRCGLSGHVVRLLGVGGCSGHVR